MHGSQGDAKEIQRHLAIDLLCLSSLQRAGCIHKFTSIFVVFQAIGYICYHMPKPNISTGLEPLRSTSGLVVKSIVAIDGPRVRFAASAAQFFLHSFLRIAALHYASFHFAYAFALWSFTSFWVFVFECCGDAGLRSSESPRRARAVHMDSWTSPLLMRQSSTWNVSSTNASLETQPYFCSVWSTTSGFWPYRAGIWFQPASHGTFVLAPVDLSFVTTKNGGSRQTRVRLAMDGHEIRERDLLESGDSCTYCFAWSCVSRLRSS